MGTSNWNPTQRGTDPAWYGLQNPAPGSSATGNPNSWWNWQASQPKPEAPPPDPFKDMGKQFGQSGRSSFEAYGGFLNPYAKQYLMDFYGNDYPMIHNWAHNLMSNLTTQGGIDSLAGQFGVGAAGQANTEAGRNYTQAALLGLGGERMAAGNNLAATNRATDATNNFRSGLMTGDVQSKIMPMLSQILGTNPALEQQLQLASIITGLPVKKRGGLSLGSVLGAASSIGGILGGFGGLTSGGGSGGGGGAGIGGLLGGGGVFGGQ